MMLAVRRGEVVEHAFAVRNWGPQAKAGCLEAPPGPDIDGLDPGLEQLHLIELGPGEHRGDHRPPDPTAANSRVGHERDRPGHCLDRFGDDRPVASLARIDVQRSKMPQST